MAIIPIDARMEQHTITGTGLTFSAAANLDFTQALTQSAGNVWSTTDLYLSEIGVNETDNKAYIRIGDNINQFKFVDGGNTNEWMLLHSGALSAGESQSIGITISIGINYLIETVETTSSTYSKAFIYSTKSMLYYNGASVMQSSLFNSGTSSIAVGDSYINRNVWLVTATNSDIANIAYNLEINGGEAVEYVTTLKYKVETTN